MSLTTEEYKKLDAAKVTAKELHRDEENDHAFWADGVFIEIDERIISVDEISEA
jgi:hypothetical protein